MMNADLITADLLARTDFANPRDPSTWRLDGMALATDELETVRNATVNDFAAADVIAAAYRATVVAELRMVAESMIAHYDRTGHHVRAAWVRERTEGVL